MRHAHFILGLSLSAAALSGCSTDQLAAGNGRSTGSSKQASEQTLPSGTAIDVALTTALTWKTAGIGDAWIGATRGALIIDGPSLIPGGSPVSGTVTAVKVAEPGDRAMLALVLSSIRVDGRTYRVRAATQAIVAGSTRAGTALTFTTQAPVAVRISRT